MNACVPHTTHTSTHTRISHIHILHATQATAVNFKLPSILGIGLVVVGVRFVVGGVFGGGGGVVDVLLLVLLVWYWLWGLCGGGDGAVVWLGLPPFMHDSSIRP